MVACLQFGNVVLAIQPPRGFGENPIAIYHDPALPPSHHYLAAYRWLEREFGADAVVHLGKHGTLEWLPGKGLGLSASCAPDAVLGDLPLFYPFIVNDPGEGTQAKRRGHATIVDHLVPPMARADTYNELAKLEQLLDEHASVAALDPVKLPVIRAQIWELVTAAQLHHDLHVDEAPAQEEFDEFILHIDGYLCEIKDVQIRDGLHILGGAPEGEALVNLVLGMLRAEQTWAGDGGAVPGLRRALTRLVGLDEKALLAEPGAQIAVPARLSALADGPARTAADAVDLIEAVARRLVEGLHDAGWDPYKVPVVVEEILGEPAAGSPAGADVCRHRGGAAAGQHHRRDRQPAARSERRLRPGWAERLADARARRGAADRAQLLQRRPQGDPVAAGLDGGRCARRVADHAVPRGQRRRPGRSRSVWWSGAPPRCARPATTSRRSCGCWGVGRSGTRRLVGSAASRWSRTTSCLRPRIDVTVRISGFFRDAFPHVVQLIDDAVTAVAALDEPDERNFVAAHARADASASMATGAGRRRGCSARSRAPTAPDCCR